MIRKIKVTDYPRLMEMIVFQKVCKSQIFYFCNGTFKNEYLWNLHMNKSRK